MEYQTFDPEIHDSHLIAEYRYEVDFRTFDKLFSSKDKAVSSIERCLRKDECIKVILDDGEIIGMLMFYTHDKKPKSYFKSLRLFIVDILDYFVICDIGKQDFYIAEIAVDKKHRSKGYGSKIIREIIDYAEKNKYKRVILDADFRNPKAKALYERLGFKVYNKKSFLKRGMYNMEFNVS
ncbi:GNAT family N-acetyltransferase [Methanobrevibacter sp.]|uniref:GNAT family N-acetyltransferase n=1 Tax=Methanobrevibacter sp. TaxID=66852 RepID=UPI0038907A75